MTPVTDEHFNYIYFLQQPVELYPVDDQVYQPDRLFHTIEQISTQTDQLLGWVVARVIDRHNMLKLYPDTQPTQHLWWIVDPHELVPDCMTHQVLLGVIDDIQH